MKQAPGNQMTSRGKIARADVREKILNEATRLFGERGFRGVALRDVAATCKIPLSTLSSHFARKEDLQDEVFDRAVGKIIKRVLSSSLHDGTPKQRFRQYIVNVAELFLSDLPEMKVLDREWQELDKAATFSRVVRSSTDRTTVDSVRFTAEMVKSTNSDILETIPAIRVAQMVFSAIYGIIKLRSVHRSAGGRQVSDATLTRHIVLMVERMLKI